MLTEFSKMRWVELEFWFEKNTTVYKLLYNSTRVFSNLYSSDVRRAACIQDKHILAMQICTGAINLRN